MELEKIYRGMENGAEALQTNFEKLLNMCFPVGSIIENKKADYDPNNELPGTWTLITGKVIVGVDPTDTDFSQSGMVGGSKNHSHSLTGVAQMQLSGTYLGGNFIDSAAYTATVKATTFNGIAERTARSVGVNINGTANSTKSLMPYMTAYIWERIS